jgi:hypothetical protein
MDLTGQELHLIAFLSSAQDTLKRAEAIIGLAESNPDNATTLSACATILLAAALEQAVRTILSESPKPSRLRMRCMSQKPNRPSMMTSQSGGEYSHCQASFPNPSFDFPTTTNLQNLLVNSSNP